MVVEAIVVAALHGAYGGLTWVAWANSRGVAVFLVLWPMAYGLWPWGGVVVPLPGACRSAEARDQGCAA